ncbi:MAG: hypothetical protein ACD_49C00052G0008 [uncultured bacterium (gcode 4)]|uniref:Uncharacterized protein n=1 Tax=uncultured bacterium (gcode 4) TaxID=1234023 RepID=K2AX50_9BACT|nr:MAG: hypothetical protein ACD_49C00052G0008 [uncultured bacterium (gcode 4)]
MKFEWPKVDDEVKKHDNPNDKKSLNNPNKSPERNENSEKNEQDKLDKVSLEVINNTEEILKDNGKISDENKGQLNLVSLMFKDELWEVNKNFELWEISKKEKEKELQRIYKNLIIETNDLIWRKEWIPAKKSKEFADKIDQDNRDYKIILNEYSDKLKIENWEKLANKRIKEKKNNENKWLSEREKAPREREASLEKLFPWMPENTFNA